MTGIISLAVNELNVRETNSFAAVSFLRSGNTSGPVTITYEITGDGATAGEDFVASAGTVRIPAGAGQATIQVPILNDARSEPTEDFIVSILSVSSGTLNAPRTTRVNILDDENPVVTPPEPPLVSDYVVDEVPILQISRPVDIEFVPGQDNIMLVATQAGLIKVFDTDTNTFKANFIDLTREVGRGAGLQSIELHPDFPEEPYVYAYYSVDPPESASKTGSAGLDGNGNRFQWLARFEADPSAGYLKALPNSKVVLLGGAGQSLDDISGGGALNFGDGPAYKDLPASDRINLSAEELAAGLEYRQNYIKGDGDHIGAGMAFGPDGNLYLSIGDGVAFNFADPRVFAVQDLDSLSGKVVRIDPITGKGLTDNPFYEPGDSLDLNRSKVFQYGLRNPFSLSFTDDGSLVVTDTGQSSYEEINIGAPGANFGWPFYEGADFDRLFSPALYRPTQANGFQDEWNEFLAGNPQITRPFRGFAHKELEPGFQFQAITGGDVDYSGDRYPDSLNGHYFFSDFSDGEVFTIDLDDRSNVQLLYKKDGVAPVAFTQGPDGDVYYVDIVGGKVGFLRIEEIETDPAQTMGAVRQVTGLSDAQKTVSYGSGVALENPVVFASPVTLFADTPVTVELLQIGATSARFRLQEPDYLDGVHRAETVTLLALEEGVWDVGGGRQLEVGLVTVPTGTGFTSVAFTDAFATAPLILTQIQVDGDPEWAVVRTTNITRTGFSLKLQEEEANDGLHGATSVGFLAIEPETATNDVFDWNDTTVQAFTTGKRVTQTLTTFDYAADLGNNALVAAGIASFFGTDPVNLRARHPGNGTVRFQADEEQSADSEVQHGAEVVHGLAFEGAGALTGTDLL